ncbi:MAG: WD40 repeat domain-containing serine/threonine protein kinase [Planctomycetota bacterium]
MTGSPDPDRADDAELFDFVSTYLADRAFGTLRGLAEYQARFPGLEAAIAREYARLGADDGATTQEQRLGPYRVLRQLGSGGQGVVLLAEDTRLGRRVALKVLAPHLAFVSSERLQRFRREAEILSQLDHPGICPVYEAATHDGAPYLAMRYVEGRTLAAELRLRRDDGVPRTRAAQHEVMRWIELAAHAAHEAHEHGVVHRDIKPGNLMLSEQGPVLLDFGLARLEAESETDITRSGSVLGTPAYTAPEVLAHRRADRRADVYALGVTLYECLTHATPFRGEATPSLWRAIERGDAAPVRDLNPTVPAELAAVVATAMARDPAQRYATAADFAADLERVRRREPILARPQPRIVRLLRWAQRHPTLSTALGAGVAWIALLTLSLFRVRAEERVASALHRAIQASDTDDGAAAALADLIDAGAAGGPRADLRSAVLQVLDACHLAWHAPRTPVPPNTVDPPPAIDPTGRLVAVGDAKGVVAVRALGSGAAVARRAVTAGRVLDIAFVGADRLCVTTAGAALLLDATSLVARAAIDLPPADAAVAARANGGVLIATSGALELRDPDDLGLRARVDLTPSLPIRRVLPSPDGARAAVLGRDPATADPHGCTRCWIVDLAARRVVMAAPAPAEDFVWAVWHPDGAALALAGNGGHVQVCAATDGRVLFERRVDQEVNWCGFDPGGELLLVPTDQGTDLWRWRTADPAPARHLPHPSERTIGAAGFDVDDRLFAALLRDGSVLVFDTDDWRPVRQFKHRVRDARYLHWIPRAGALVTADLDALSVWCAGVRPHAPELWGHRDAVTAVAMHPDSRRVLTGSRDGSARLWSIDRTAPLAAFEHGGRGVREVRFCADGSRLLTIDADGAVRTFDTERLAPLPAPPTAGCVDARFRGPGGAQLVTIGEDGTCRRFDVATGTALRVMTASDAPLRSMALAAERPWCAVGGADRHVTVFDLERGAVVRRIRVSEIDGDWRVNPLHQVRAVAFASNDDLLLASLVNNQLLGWRIDDDWRQSTTEIDRFGGPLAPEPETGAVLCADYSFGRLSLWRGGRLQALEVDGHSAHANRIAAIRVAPGGGTALSAGHDGMVRIWDLRTGRPVHAMRAAAAVLDADFSADGRWVVTGCADGTVKLWPRDPLPAARAYLAVRDGAR